MMLIKFMDQEHNYTGRELRSHFIRTFTGIKDDGIVAFIGRADVVPRKMVDLEDRERDDHIESARMLHFIGEFFGIGLREMNYRLRLFIEDMRYVINHSRDIGVSPIHRDGDDLYQGNQKLSVAIATISPVSALFHFGVNIDPTGAPVPAVGLDEITHVGEHEDFSKKIKRLALTGMGMFGEEVYEIEEAIRKVEGVR